MEVNDNVMLRQKVRTLIANSYSLCEENKDVEFKDQLRRASESILNNIEESNERKVNNEFRIYLYKAVGACIEVRSILLKANEQKKIKIAEFQSLLLLTLEISKIILSQIKNNNTIKI